ncbi:MAG: hypothetical protein F4X87_00785 [Chloroflexi bacterium]|nr:hypothetical protein [Chloroflexota bacterium]
MATTEHTINDAIAELLRGTRWAWRGQDVVRSETTQLLAESGGLRPDILILEPYTAPVVIETEVMPAQSVEEEALGRLGEKLRGSDETVLSAIALRLPQRFREAQGDSLRLAILAAQDMEFAHFAGRGPDKYTRHPQSGWLTGDIRELSILTQSATMPSFLIDEAATILEVGVNAAEWFLSHDVASRFPNALIRIAEELQQQDSVQTRRMAMTILINAFMFHANLAQGPGDLAHVRTFEELKDIAGNPNAANAPKALVADEWRKILKVNYWPIFDIALRIIERIPVLESNKFVENLANTARNLMNNNLLRSHDLTGTVFQKLIADRKFLAAFYTKPASAALLVGLAINEDSLPNNDDWADPDAVTSLRIGDFACGTGTLLSTAYQRISQLHELHGGNAAAIHAEMIENVILGCDILPAAAHLTASMLSGAHPTVQYQGGRIFTLRYGRQEDGTVALGAIDLLRDLALLKGSEITAKAAEGLGEAEMDAWRSAPHVSFDLVIMNPPFTRATNHERRIPDTPNPNYAAFGASASEQKAMAEEAKKITRGTVAHGNAGEASVFLALADRKIARNGMLAMVMPVTLLTGSSWEKCRSRLAESYENLILISIAGRGNEPLSFSADTNLGECLVIGKRNGQRQTRATFIVLENSPQHPAFSVKIAKRIRELIKDKAIRPLEGSPVGGTQITLGNEIVGQAIDAPLPKSGSWKLGRIADFSLAQSAYQLSSKSVIWLPAQQSSDSLKIQMTAVADIGKTGPYHLDVSKRYSDGTIRGPFEIGTLQKDVHPSYPILWAHDANRERTMVFEADREGVPFAATSKTDQSAVEKKVSRVLQTASHCHSNLDFRFNSQSTAMQFTAHKTIGGTAWISIQLSTIEQEKALALWGNTLLALLMFWWHSSKQQPGRGRLAKTTLDSLPILDVTALSADQLARATQIFDEACQLPLKPLHELDIDENRKTLDRRFYGEVLGLPDSILADGGPLDILRQKLSREPSIRGSKPPPQTPP